MTDISSHRFFKNKRYQQLTLCIITFFMYFNTLSNDYALDDRAVITENTVTQKGIGGIKELLTHHYYYGQISHNTHIYRPVPSITHALEWQFFKKNPGISHLINILLFLFTVLVFFQLCTFFFKKYSQGLFLSFLASLIFAIHPLHTEVVANIKGRDELLSLLFLLLAFNYLLQHFNIKGIKHLLITGLFLVLALFSKESAALYILYLPLILFFFTPLSFSKSIIKSLPFMLLLPVYFLIIKSVIGWGKVEDQVIFNVPYLYASESAAFATKVFVILKYISLFIVPHPLICDYSYNHIPYINFSDYRFWLAFSINICLLVYALVTFKSKNIIAFCILFFYSSIAIVSNLFVQTGVIMAERSAYVGSVAFCIFLAILYHKLFMTKLITANRLLKYSIYLFYILLITAFSLKTIARNKDWKNDFQLFTNDVNYAPNSAKLLELSAIFNYFYNPSFPNGTIPNVAIRNESILKLKRSIEILPNNFPESYAYLTYIYLSIDSVDQAYAVYNDVTHKGMATPQLTDLKQRICEAYLTKGDSCFIHKDADCAIANFKKAIDVNPANARAWWNYGGISYEKGNKAATIEAWEKVLLLNPEYPKAKELLQQVKMSPDSKP